jgi:hypothetical protein
MSLTLHRYPIFTYLSNKEWRPRLSVFFDLWIFQLLMTALTVRGESDKYHLNSFTICVINRLINTIDTVDAAT